MLISCRRALRSWTSVWQQAPESSLDPHNENGPIPFTSSALLGMAYVRLSLNLGPYRQLETRDPYRIAAALYRSPRPGRSYRLTPALIYAAHALSIPVRLGIDHVARSQAFFWSVRHSIASLDCAILLSKWLLSLAEPASDQNLSGMLQSHFLTFYKITDFHILRQREPHFALDPLHRSRSI